MSCTYRGPRGRDSPDRSDIRTAATTTTTPAIRWPVVCALLHDIGDTLGSYNHADVAAVLLEPFVSAENEWMVKHHGIFQGYYFFHHMGMDRNLRDQYRDVPGLFKRTAHFCEKYDAAAFDPDAETLPLEFFEPTVRRVFAEPKRTLYKAAFEKIG